MKILKPEEAFDKSAELYQDKFMDVSLYAEPFNVFFEHITSDNASILDIACGPGNIVKYLLDRKPDYDILGIDLSSKMLSLALINNPKAKFELMDCRDIDQIEQKFDGITCGFCLPYLTGEEAADLIANTAGLLKPGGVFYLSTMEQDEDNKSRYQVASTGDQVFVNYHQEEYLSNALRQSGFEILSIDRFDSPGQGELKITDLVLIGKLN
ncbi:class I SAM-dependent DNA methyltransferase [Pedobacter psychroterrae]|uniref:Class I SAM-dependent methyltransferase n=1 Tax=Pedobacter psychroterrae TaxID=2530453 RepID=A0A4R0NLY8_9SPHI|nr:class I SAM-dependent methyltransferase [Pedobacter psychroterrae]TCD01666.1 class I SAM-dependent methyltransferase [Pedobacter psychroterrae]